MGLEAITQHPDYESQPELRLPVSLLASDQESIDVLEYLETFGGFDTRRGIVAFNEMGTPTTLYIDPFPSDVPSGMEAPSHKVLRDINGLTKTARGVVMHPDIGESGKKVLVMLPPYDDPSIPLASFPEIQAAAQNKILFLKRSNITGNGQ